MKIMQSIKVSLIIPVYNVEDYIEKCLRSVLSQTLKDIEIIIVNDGSTDQSMKIVGSFEDEHSNIHIINKKNGGLSSARNRGLKVASGKYVAFIDSDDYIDETMLQQLYNSAEANNLDIVSCDLTKVDLSGKVLGIEKNTLKYDHTYDKHEVIGEYLLNNIPSYAWNKLYKKELFDKYEITYPEGRLYEDIKPTFELLSKAVKVGFIDKPLYFYVQRGGAITKVPSFKAGFDIIKTIDDIKSSLEESKLYYKYEEVFQNFSLKYVFLANVLFYKWYFKTKDKIELEKFKSLVSIKIKQLSLKSILLNKYLSNGDKLKYMLLKTRSLCFVVSMKELLLKAKNKPSMEG
ncbi:glycosyltransferase [Clostridium algoriphilum]|uniref:glycosyltransferase n=1 Tax=Clostridium algoriphilum TaxID=198347 RepID=UPI001CF26C58|nr:glycosyltransferase [Clostridium algoriphilum]MCB2293951.1 glycosyltransferase [Clostridium algoriphilum]